MTWARSWSADRRSDPLVETPVDEGTASREGWCVADLVLFRSATPSVLLLGGDKTGAWNEWYEWAVPLADDLCDEYLQELGEEGLI